MRIFETDIFRRKIAQVNNLEEQGKVNKPNSSTIGTPIGNPQPTQENPENLPIISTEDLGKILEDSLEEEQYPSNQTPEEEQQQEIEQQPIVPEPEEEKEQIPTFSNIFDAVKWAQENNQVMRINYITEHGKPLTRDVEPHGEFHSESSHKQILVTFDETVSQIRAFIMTNIQNWAFPGKKFNKRFIVRA